MLRIQPWLAILALVLSAVPLAAAEPPQLQGLRVQTLGDTTYFTAKLPNLPDYHAPSYGATRGWWTEQGRAMARTPRLVPQDDKAYAVYYLPAQHLFVGKVTGPGPANFELLYPKHAKDRPMDGRKELPKVLTDVLNATTWANVPVTLDFAKAAVVESSKRLKPRPPALPFPCDDLELLWATAQAEHFAVLEAQAPEFGFFGLAREATVRKYDVYTPKWVQDKPFDREQIYREAYAITSGAAAITESLQLKRLRDGTATPPEARTVDVKKVQGITIAEHPWVKMMAGKKPTPEPLSKLVPHDNYYLHFKNLAKFIELGELADQWGGNLNSLFDLNSRDYQVKQRYEKQLCLRSTAIGKTLGPFVVRSMAITGNDPYLREGSDLAILFHTVSKKLFLSAVDQFIQEARQEFGKDLKETTYGCKGVTVEQFTTPLREVSLHRTTLDDIVIYANSEAGMRRILSAHKGDIRSLGDSLDFQYMRTVMRLEDKLEDGFLFLSDAFIRQLVGPESKIKERRRIEALTSLAMVTNGALFHAWETGKLPADHAALLKGAHLRPEELEIPDGKGIVWNAERRLAVSDVYNTQLFATPLVELPIDMITPNEEREYTQFRDQYMGLWRQFFDPVGIRLQLTDQRVRLETYILPLINSGQYSFLRQFSGNGVSTFDLSRVGKETLLQWFARVDVNQALGLRGIGDQITIRLDDDGVYEKWLERYLHWQLRPRDPQRIMEEGRLIPQMPLTLGVKIAKEEDFDEELKKLTGLLDFIGKHEKRLYDHKGVPITHIKFKAGIVVDEVNRGRDPDESVFLPSLYHAKIDGFWHVSFREEPIKSLIDQAVTRGNKVAREDELIQGNSTLHLAPSAAVQARRALKLYQEWESHCRSVANCSAWHTLFRAKLLPPEATKQQMHRAAKHWYGYVPISPDLRPYVYLAKSDEVENIWHGSARNPQMRGGFDEHAPLSQLLEQFKTIRADLRFKEDGINTVVTIERGKK